MNKEGAVKIAQAAFAPITWSQNDTKETVRQIKIHNQVGVELGIWKYPPNKTGKTWFRRSAVSQLKKPAPVASPPVEPASVNETAAPTPTPVAKPPQKKKPILERLHLRKPKPQPSDG